jgi:hypothetical protein
VALPIRVGSELFERTTALRLEPQARSVRPRVRRRRTVLVGASQEVAALRSSRIWVTLVEVIGNGTLGVLSSRSGTRALSPVSPRLEPRRGGRSGREPERPRCEHECDDRETHQREEQEAKGAKRRERPTLRSGGVRALYNGANRRRTIHVAMLAARRASDVSIRRAVRGGRPPRPSPRQTRRAGLDGVAGCDPDSLPRPLRSAPRPRPIPRIEGTERHSRQHRAPGMPAVRSLSGRVRRRVGGCGLLATRARPSRPHSWAGADRSGTGRSPVALPPRRSVRTSAS